MYYVSCVLLLNYIGKWNFYTQYSVTEILDTYSLSFIKILRLLIQNNIVNLSQEVK